MMMNENKVKLNALFAGLRKRKLIARQNYMCCGGCAGAQIFEDAKVRCLDGGVFFHRQEGDRLREGQEEVYLAYGSVDENSLPVARVGEMIREEAERVGLEVKWDGDPSKCVVVVLPGGVN